MNGVPSTPMSERMPTIGVLLAGGSGARSGLEYPKQFLRLGGITVLEHALSVFESESSIDSIVIVASESWIDETKDIILSRGSQKACNVISGGTNRSDSSKAAIEFIYYELGVSTGKVLLHDAVRPLIDGSILRAVVVALDEFDAVDVVIDTADTIIQARNGVIVDIPRRSELRRGQTPQGFEISRLKAAYDAMAGDSLSDFTDDCSVMMTAFPDVPIATVEGSEENIKITKPLDIYLADRLLQGRQVPAASLGDENGTLNGVVVVFGGTSGIGESLTDQLNRLNVEAVGLSRSSGVDVRSGESVRHALERTRSDFGPIAAVVNTAGILLHGPLLGSSQSDIELEIDINLKGALMVARCSFEYLVQSEGHLLMFTSSSYTRGRANYATYSATKAGIVNITQALSEEWLGSKVRVNCLNPSRTNTPMRRRAFGDEPLHTLLTTEEVAKLAIDVLRSRTTGHVFDVRPKERQ